MKLFLIYRPLKHCVTVQNIPIVGIKYHWYLNQNKLVWKSSPFFYKIYNSDYADFLEKKKQIFKTVKIFNGNLIFHLLKIRY